MAYFFYTPLLEGAGYLVGTADIEAKGLSILSKPAKFDAVITDMSMEHAQSGLQVARAASQLRPRPVIISF